MLAAAAPAAAYRYGGDAAEPVLDELDSELRGEFDRWRKERKQQGQAQQGTGYYHAQRGQGHHGCLKSAGSVRRGSVGRRVRHDDSVRVTLLLEEECSTRRMVAASEGHGWDLLRSHARSCRARLAAVTSSRDALDLSAQISTASAVSSVDALRTPGCSPSKLPMHSAGVSTPPHQRIIKQTGQRPHTAPANKSNPFVFNKQTPHQAFTPYVKRPMYYPSPLNEDEVVPDAGAVLVQGRMRPRSAPGGGGGGGQFIATPDSVARKKRQREDAARQCDSGATPDHRGDRDGVESTFSTWSLSSLASPSVMMHPSPSPMSQRTHGGAVDHVHGSPNSAVKPLMIHDVDLLCDTHSEAAHTIATPSSAVSVPAFSSSVQCTPTKAALAQDRPASRVGSAGSQRSGGTRSRPQSASTQGRTPLQHPHTLPQGAATPGAQEKPPLAPPKAVRVPAPAPAPQVAAAAADTKPAAAAWSTPPLQPAKTPPHTASPAPAVQQVSTPTQTPPLAPVTAAAPPATPEAKPVEMAAAAAPAAEAVKGAAVEDAKAKAEAPAAAVASTPLPAPRHMPLPYTQVAAQDVLIASAVKQQQVDVAPQATDKAPAAAPSPVAVSTASPAMTVTDSEGAFTPKRMGSPRQRHSHRRESKASSVRLVVDDSPSGGSSKRVSTVSNASRGSRVSLGPVPETPSVQLNARREIFELLEDQSLLREAQLFHIRKNRDEILEGLPTELVPFPTEEDVLLMHAASPQLAHRLGEEKARVEADKHKPPGTLETVLVHHREELARMEQLQLPAATDTTTTTTTTAGTPGLTAAAVAAPATAEIQTQTVLSAAAALPSKQKAAGSPAVHSQGYAPSVAAGLPAADAEKPRAMKPPRNVAPLERKEKKSGKAKPKRSALRTTPEDWSLLPSGKRSGHFYPAKLQQAMGIEYPVDESGHELSAPPTREGHPYEFFYFSRAPATAYESFCAKANKKRVMAIDAHVREEINARAKMRKKEKEERVAILKALQNRMLYYKYVFTEEQVFKMNVEKLINAEDSGRQLIEIEEVKAQAPLKSYPEYEFTLLEKQAKAYGDVHEPLAHEPVIDPTDVLYTADWDEDQKIRTVIEKYDTDIAACRTEEVSERECAGLEEEHGWRVIMAKYAAVASSWFDRHIAALVMAQYNERMYMQHDEEVSRETLFLLLCNNAAVTAEITGQDVPLQLYNRGV